MGRAPVEWIGKGLTESRPWFSKMNLLPNLCSNCNNESETRKLQYHLIYDYILKTNNNDRVVYWWCGVFKSVLG